MFSLKKQEDLTWHSSQGLSSPCLQRRINRLSWKTEFQAHQSGPKEREVTLLVLCILRGELLYPRVWCPKHWEGKQKGCRWPNEGRLRHSTLDVTLMWMSACGYEGWPLGSANSSLVMLSAEGGGATDLGKHFVGFVRDHPHHRHGRLSRCLILTFAGLSSNIRDVRVTKP